MEHLTPFTPVSPDPDIQNLGDQGLAKFGHLNALIAYIQNAPSYGSNAAALAGGLQVGDLYKFTPVPGVPTLIAIVV
jgi:hypothetical protein